MKKEGSNQGKGGRKEDGRGDMNEGRKEGK